jgi:hypothetical protein
MAQQKSSLVESNRQVKALREENQQLVQNQEPRNDLSLNIMESLKIDLLHAQSQTSECEPSNHLSLIEIMVVQLEK